MDRRSAYCLINSVREIPKVRLHRLFKAFGGPTEVLAADAHAWVSSGALTPLMAQRLQEARSRFDVSREFALAAQEGARILTWDDEDYPENLREIIDAPVVLYVLGGFIRADTNAVGIVGSRGASTYGRACAREFGAALAAAGLTVASGMARGVDTEAHRGALEAGGRTVAVLGSGLCEIYPPENERLFGEIAERGAVVSEFPMETGPLPENFPVRNRIISGLSKGVLVVEASQRSGALITARLASEQGREVFAIPGKVSSPTSSGTNDLIKDGVRLVTSPDEVLEGLAGVLRESLARLKGVSRVPRPRPDLESDESIVLKALGDEPVPVDVICQRTGFAVGRLMALLMGLELKGCVQQQPGALFCAVLT